MAQFVHYSRKSILRKRYYSFKHSGNSRGGHRGPEKVCSDWQSGRKMGELGFWVSFGAKIIKKRQGHNESPVVRIPWVRVFRDPLQQWRRQNWKVELFIVLAIHHRVENRN